MIKSLKIRLKPNKSQEKQLYKSANTARFIYNWTLNKQIENYKQGNKFISDNVLKETKQKSAKSLAQWMNTIWFENKLKNRWNDGVSLLILLSVDRLSRKPIGLQPIGSSRKELTQLKKSELSFLSEVSNNVAKQSVKDCCVAFKNFFNKKSKFPRFKTKKKSKLSFYNDNVKLKSKGKKVLLEKIGWVKTSEELPQNKYMNPRISLMASTGSCP